jgi:glycosyltransferase involved in cell wall biosynthesis
VTLVYLSEARIPSRSSNSMQTMRMCAAFAAAGADVTLLHQRHDGDPPEGFAGDVEGFYGVPSTFARQPLKGLSTRRLDRAGRLSRPLRAAVLAAHVGALGRPGARTIDIYTRSYMAAALAIRARRLAGRRSGIRSIWVEIHDEPPSPAAWRTLEKVDGLVVISRSLAEALESHSPALRGSVHVEHDGVDLGSVQRDRLDREGARRRLGLDGAGGPVVVYTGRVNLGKGVGVLLAATPPLQHDLGARVVLVGKVYDDALRAVEGVRLTGFVPPSEVPDYLAAADLLVMPTTEDLPYSAFTSPLKLFEYMASGRPVVASALPGVCEVIRDGENGLLYPPADHDALEQAIRALCSDPERAGRMAEQAFQDVQAYAWDRRAERILARISGAAPARPA